MKTDNDQNLEILIVCFGSNEKITEKNENKKRRGKKFFWNKVAK